MIIKENETLVVLESRNLGAFDVEGPLGITLTLVRSERPILFEYGQQLCIVQPSTL
jgi:hypothetical protein